MPTAAPVTTQAHEPRRGTAHSSPGQGHPLGKQQPAPRSVGGCSQSAQESWKLAQRHPCGPRRSSRPPGVRTQLTGPAGALVIAPCGVRHSPGVHTIPTHHSTCAHSADRGMGARVACGQTWATAPSKTRRSALGETATGAFISVCVAVLRSRWQVAGGARPFKELPLHRRSSLRALQRIGRVRSATRWQSSRERLHEDDPSGRALRSR